jgi:very-short-patch-repair endonuclease
MTSTTLARRLRREQTDAERNLWFQLRGRRLEGLKFRRQAPVAGYVADFLCEDAKLIVEVDGGQHDEQLLTDDLRSKVLQGCGYEVLGFWNNDVLSNMDGVLRRIVEAVRLARNEM